MTTTAILKQSTESVTRNICIDTVIFCLSTIVIYNSLVSSGCISGVRNILFKYNFSIVNNILNSDSHLPSKGEWKKAVSIPISKRRSHDLDQGMSLD